MNWQQVLEKYGPRIKCITWHSKRDNLPESIELTDGTIIGTSEDAIWIDEDLREDDVR